MNKSLIYHVNEKRQTRQCRGLLTSSNVARAEKGANKFVGSFCCCCNKINQNQILVPHFSVVFTAANSNIKIDESYLQCSAHPQLTAGIKECLNLGWHNSKSCWHSKEDSVGFWQHVWRYKWHVL